MNAWFGTDWGARMCQDTPHVATPVGAQCLWCDEPIAPGDSGIVTPFMESVGNIFTVGKAYYHLECWVRSILGSIGHQLRLCPCFGGDYEGEPEGMSKRDAARAAWDLAQQRAVSDKD